MGVTHDLSAAFETPTVAETLGLESNIITILSSKPELLGLKLKLVNKEFETGSGVVDIVFKDPDGTHILVEVKDTADQETVGQVLKQSNGMKSKLGINAMRQGHRRLENLWQDLRCLQGCRYRTLPDLSRETSLAIAWIGTFAILFLEFDLHSVSPLSKFHIPD